MMDEWIDFHAHILPKIDHGCDCLDTSVSQLKLAEDAGIRCIVATSHFYPDRVGMEDFPARRDKALEELRNAYTGPVRILAGAEVLLCEGLQNYRQLSGLCAEKTRVLLIEMPTPPWPARLLNTLFALCDMGYEPVIAHIDRYPRRDMDALLASGFRGQLDSDGIFPPYKRGRAIRLIDEGTVCALGSDIHGAARKAYQNYCKAMRTLDGRGILLQKRMNDLLNR